MLHFSCVAVLPSVDLIEMRIRPRGGATHECKFQEAPSQDTPLLHVVDVSLRVPLPNSKTAMGPVCHSFRV